MKRFLALSTAMGLVAGPALADVNLLSWGGAYGNSHLEAYAKPFTAETGINVVMSDADNPATPIKAQVEAGNVSVDVASVEYADAVRLCDEGALEMIDPAILLPAEDGTAAADDFIDGAVTECFVATDVYSMVLAFNETAFPEAKPATPADFFDLEAFPGKRTMRKGAKFNLELALMADGVPAAEVYDVLSTPEGVDRAFAKLDTIKSEVIWWEAGAQPRSFLPMARSAWPMPSTAASSTRRRPTASPSRSSGTPRSMRWRAGSCRRARRTWSRRWNSWPDHRARAPGPRRRIHQLVRRAGPPPRWSATSRAPRSRWAPTCPPSMRTWPGRWHRT